MSAVAVARGLNSAHGGTEMKLHRAARFGEVSKEGPSNQRIAETDIKASGTRVAIRRLSLGGAAHSAKPSGRGGARNRADRVTWFLSAKQVENLQAAVKHAALLRLPLNRMITVHWESGGVSPARMVKATGRFLDLLTRWLARRGTRTAWIAVHENGTGKGAHAHILVHVPSSLVKALGGRNRAWLRRICGRPYRDGVIHSRPVGGLLGAEQSNEPAFVANLGAALSYVTKGADPSAAAVCGLHRVDGGGPVIGRRCSTSQNIGAKARKEDSHD